MRTVVLLLGIFMSVEVQAEQTVTVWFGTRGSSIYRATLNQENGKLTEAEAVADIKSPGFLCVNAAGTLLNSLGNASGEDNVAVYKVDGGKELSLLGTANSGCGKGTHISLSHDERTLLVAHYGGGKVASFPIDDAGKILPPTSQIAHQGSSVNKSRQSEPHPHWIGVTPDNGFAVVPDLGLDQVVIYRLNTDDHTLTPHGAGKVPPGDGPRHLKFHPNGEWAYVINELGLTVTAFQYDKTKGTLDAMQTIEALPKSEVKDVLTSGSEIRIHPNGKFVYAGIRGHDIIAVFRVNESTGELTFVEREPIRGSWPRNFGIDPSGKWLLAAGAESSTVSVFRIDPDDGRLTFTRNVIHVPNSICVTFQPQ